MILAAAAAAAASDEIFLSLNRLLNPTALNKAVRLQVGCGPNSLKLRLLGSLASHGEQKLSFCADMCGVSGGRLGGLHLKWWWLRIGETNLKTKLGNRGDAQQLSDSI